MAAEASNSSESNLRETKHGKLFLGDLPSGFLEVSAPTLTQVQRDEQMAQQIARQQFQQQAVAQPTAMLMDRLFISVLEAKLNKNYGVVRMDPYCRIRINHNVYDTDTAYNGAKNPHWTKSISAAYSEEIQTLYLEVFDEKSLTTDIRIAWADISLPPAVKEGKQVDDWWPLSGKLGEEVEGSVHIVISKKKVRQNVNQVPGMPVMMPPMALQQSGVVYANNPYYAPVAGAPGFYPPPNHQAAIRPQQVTAAQQPVVPVQQGPMFTPEDVAKLKEMFPSMEDDAIKAVLEASRGNKDAAIHSILAMQ